MIGEFIAQRIGAQTRFATRPKPFIWLGRFVFWTPLATTAIGATLGYAPFGSMLGAAIGGLAGLVVGGLIVVSSLEKYFIIRNTTTGAFITQDPFASIAGAADEDFHIAYGPGVHISLPWERRLPANNISLEEVAQDFEIKVQCKDGTITLKGSFRLRANLDRGVVFLRGAAAIASEINDLIAKVAIEDLADKSVHEALLGIAGLNTHLHDIITNGDSVSTLEERFGIDITDATVAEVLPSEELQRTLGALSEAAAISKGTAALLGMTEDEMKAALVAGTLSNDAHSEARDRFMAASGNLDGMQIKRSEWVVKANGIDPKLIEAIGKLAPVASMIAGSVGGTKKPSGRSRSRGRGKPKS